MNIKNLFSKKVYFFGNLKFNINPNIPDSKKRIVCFASIHLNEYDKVINIIKRLNLRKTKNRYDLFNYNFYRRVQNGFLKIAKNKKKYLIVDSNKSISDNKIKVINKINKFL